MSKIADLSKSVKQLFEDKYGAATANQIISDAQKCIDAGGTVDQIKECLKEAVKNLSATDQVDALFILYHFVIVG